MASPRCLAAVTAISSRSLTLTCPVNSENKDGRKVNSSVTTLLQSGGTLGGPGDLMHSGAFNWLAGTDSGAGTNTFTGPVTISNNVTLSGRTMIPTVSTTVGGGSLGLASAALFWNGPGVTFSLTDDSNVGYSGGTVSIFTNAGTFQKTGAGNNAGGSGLGVSGINILFNNTGTAEAQTGTLRLSGGGQSSGVLTTMPAGRLQLNGPYTLNGGTLSGGGTVEVTGSASVSANQNRRRTLRTSVSSSIPLGNSGSSPMPHIGQCPGPICRT